MEKYEYNYAEYETPFFSEDGQLTLSKEMYGKWFKDVFASNCITYPPTIKDGKILDKDGKETYFNEHVLFYYIRDATNLHIWYDDYEEHTFKTVFYRFTPEEMDELKNDLRYDIEYVGEVHKRLQEFMLTYLEPEMNGLCNKEITKYFVKLTSMSNHSNKSYTVHNTNQILIDLVKGDRTFFELERGINTLCFREYSDADFEKNEFRCFVYNGKLTAISQYINNVNVKHNKVKIAKKIGKFIKNLGIGYPDCTIDVLFEKNKCTIVEINSFGKDMGVGPCCYNWEIDHEILYSNGEEVVVRLAKDIMDDK